MPEFHGASIAVTVRPALTAHRGKLLSGAGHGAPVHAASFIRKRGIVLETELLRHPETLRLVLVHELFHFVWARLGNPTRSGFASLLIEERRRRARGELGESAATKKGASSWKDYLCESFCDTAAWIYAGVENHPEFTLAPKWRNQRRAWFESTFKGVRHC